MIEKSVPQRTKLVFNKRINLNSNFDKNNVSLIIDNSVREVKKYTRLKTKIAHKLKIQILVMISDSLQIPPLLITIKSIIMEN